MGPTQRDTMRGYTCPTCHKELTTAQAVKNHPCDPEPVEESDTTDASEGNPNTRRLGGLLAEGVKEFMFGASRSMARDNQPQTRSSRKGPVEDESPFPEETSEETQETRKHEPKGKSASANGKGPSKTGASEELPAETSEETPGPDRSELTQREQKAFEELERCDGAITDAMLAERVGYADRSGAWKARQKWEEQRS